MNRAIDDDYDDEYFNADGEKIIENCFKGVLGKHKDKDVLMPPLFREMVENMCGMLFEWPNTHLFGNSFKYLYEQYTTNVQTNLNTHCENRLKKFFRMRAYEFNYTILRDAANNSVLFNGSDISNAVKFAYHRKDHTRGDPNAVHKMRMLLEELYYVGAMSMPDDELNIRAYTNNHWFHSMRMWLYIQRDIHRFHLAFGDLHLQWYRFKKKPLEFPRPEFPEPPKIKNFTVVPMCTFQRRHIRIDTDALYNILGGIKETPRKLGAPTKKGTVKMRNITCKEFMSNMNGSWSAFFDMDKINSQVRNKKRFVHQIVSDGVSVTVLYDRPEQAVALIDDEEIRRRHEAGEFDYELGIDPGMRTWNAAVRYCFKTNEEVTFEKNCNFGPIINLFIFCCCCYILFSG